MCARIAKLIRLALLALLAAAGAATSASAAGQSDISLSIARTSPASTATLAENEIFYVAVEYRSTVPLRLQATAADLENAPAGLMMNPVVLHPAGRGTALAWLGFQGSAKLDRLRITAYGADWSVVAVYAFPVRLAWQGKAPAREVPDWVSELSAAQSKIAAEHSANEETGLWDMIAAAVTFFVFFAVPGYFVLQVAALVKLDGRWRLAALAPLLVMVPAAIHATLALSAGSNLWPIVFIFASPLGFLYLIGLFGTRRFARPA